MLCPSCQTEFESIPKNGYVKKFCSRSCANKRIYSDERKINHSETMKKFFYSETEEKRISRIKKSVETKRDKIDRKLITEDFDNLSIAMKRERILIEQDFKCNICNSSEQWLGQKLIFELDHIDGNRKDNSRTNLRLLCPNCHSQTETFVGRKNKKVSDAEIIEASKKHDNLHQICIQTGLQPCKKSYDRIKALVAHW